jgi:hypothetical protein
MPGQIFSQGAWIDLATNFASFNAIKFSADFPGFLAGDLGKQHLLTLIHETTHHWCLITPVGTALAARSFRAYHDAAYIAADSKIGKPSRHVRQGPLDASIWASRTLTNYFVPLFEGLALYAEWRACPAEGGTFSRPFDLFHMLSGKTDVTRTHEGAAARLAQMGANLSDEERTELVQEWLTSDDARRVDAALIFEMVLQLADLRRNAGERRRFKTMMRSPVDPRYSSYQLGYLFVCALETLCNSHSNTDMLMAFLREHFFGDYELAALILDEDLPLPDLYTVVRERLQEKVFELVAAPDASADRLQRWGSGTEFLSVTRETVDDFFGRHSPSSDDQPASELYSRRLYDFCRSVGSEVIPAQTIEEFLTAGRMLMPLGSSEAVAVGEEDNRQIFELDDGSRIGMATAEFGTLPGVGDKVTIMMLVNVAAPGLMVSLRWGDHFEAMSLADDSVSKPLTERVYRQSKLIVDVVEAGQSLIGRLLRIVGEGSEPIEAFAEEHLSSAAAAMDVLQIYRAAIVHAFTTAEPEVKDRRWRLEAFAAWGPNGVHSVLSDRAMFDDFLEICGMPLNVQVDGDHLVEVGIVENEANAQRISEELFEAVNSITRARYDEIADRSDAAFAAKGLRVFGTAPSGTRVSLL